MITYQAKFQGYWLDKNKAGVPALQGLYLVYRSKYDEHSNTVTLLDLIYIGQSENVQDRLTNHEKYDKFCSMLKSDVETISYSFAPVDSKEELNILENALIFAQKPELNEELKDSFNYDAAAFEIGGQCALLKHTHYSIK